MKTKGWRTRLVDYLDAADRKPFKPGSHDCALFVAGAVLEMTGKDPAKGLRGYKTIAAGMKRLADAGHPDLASFASAHFPEIAPSLARDGDIGGVVTETGEMALCVVVGAHLRVVTPAGLGILPRASMARAWSIEDVS